MHVGEVEPTWKIVASETKETMEAVLAKAVQPIFSKTVIYFDNLTRFNIVSLDLR